jgi:hypothetical protein
MSNPTQLVHVYDMPLRVIAGLSTLAKTPAEDNNTETGIVVSEVGEPVLTTHPAWADSFVSYPLRAPRVCFTPDFIFGGMDLGNAYSAFLPRRFPAPAIGTRLVINPIVTKAQEMLINMYNYVHANFHYIVHVPAPLGTGIYLKVYAPELDETTVTRGIRFKPSAQPTIAVSLPWSNDFSQVPISKPRLGQSGGSLVIETIEDNSSEQVNTPLQITVWCCVSDVKLTGYAVSTTNGFPITGFNFRPQIPPEPEPEPEPEAPAVRFVTGIQQSDNEVTAEGGKMISDFIYDKSAIPLAPEIEQQAEKPEAPASTVAEQKNDTGHLATKWYDYIKLKLSSPNNFDWNILTIDPYNDVILNQNGEALVLPWKRNVWTTGSQAIGYMRSLVAQINIPRPPQISGVLEVKDSINASSVTLIEFGGKAEIPLVPQVHNGISATLPRHWLNPWVRTPESKVQIAYRIVAFNRTSDIADLDISLLLRPGDAQFQLPQKPDNNLVPVEPDLVDQVTRYFSIKSRERISSRVVEGEQQSLNELKPNTLSDPSVFITPAIAHKAEQFNLHELGGEEDIELDEFPVLVFKGDIPVDEVTSIQLDLAKIYDFAWDGEENAISQKFKRFAHVIPKSAGGFGPVIGNYTITANLPTGVAGRIVHNCLPGDCVDLAISRIFGLKSLLGVAGSAVTAIGGPLLNGVVNTAAPILSGAAHAIGGNVVGGLADAALGLASNILTPKQKEQPSANSNAISGDIPISRFVEMVKFVQNNFETDPIFPTLLVEPQNFVTNALTKLKNIPIEVFANMRNVKVERNIFDRTVVPIVAEDELDVIIPTHAFGYILRDFLQHKRAFRPGTRQNQYFKQFLTAIRQRQNTDFVTLKQITSIPITDDLVITEIGRVKRYLSENLDGETANEFSNTQINRYD